MNRFQDMSSNRFHGQSQPNRNPTNRFHSGSRFKDSSYHHSQSSTRVFPRGSHNNTTSSSRGSRFQSNLPTNNRWKRDEHEPPSNNQPFTKTRNTMGSMLSAKVEIDPTFDPSETNSKFVNLNSMAMDFNQITVKPKQNKNKKNRKNRKVQSIQTPPAPKKYSRKYDLTDEQQDDLKNSIVNQYNYEVIEDSDEEELQEQQ